MNTAAEQDVVIAVTGVASGIGAQTAKRLTLAGHVLIGVDRDTPSDFSGEFVRADLSTSDGAKRAASSVAFSWRERQEDCYRYALAPDIETALGAMAKDAQLLDNSYLFSKQCVRLLTESLAAELLPQKVRVNSVSPGPVETPILEDFRSDHGHEKVNGAAALLGRFATPDDIARIIEFLLSNDSGWVNGADIRADGGLTAHRFAAAAAQKTPVV